MMDEINFKLIAILNKNNSTPKAGEKKNLLRGKSDEELLCFFRDNNYSIREHCSLQDSSFSFGIVLFFSFLWSFQGQSLEQQKLRNELVLHWPHIKTLLTSSITNSVIMW